MISRTILASVLVATAAFSAEGPDMLRLFPVMGWCRTTGTPRDLKQMAECCMTLCGFCSARDLDNVHAAGLMGIVQDRRLNYDWRGRIDIAAMKANIESLVADVGDHPATYGYFLKDEPVAAEFDNLALVAREILLRDPDAVPYINLFPNYASPARLGTPTYEEYVRRYVDVVRPPFISYDHYCLMEGWTRLDLYFSNLATVRKVALEHKLPFWNIVLCTGHYCYRVPTEADLRFQVYTTLAYGGKGISYFIYRTPHIANYRMGPVDEFGELTETYYRLRRVNRRLSSIAPLMLRLRSTRVSHALSDKNAPLPEGVEAFTADELVAEVSGGDFVVGEFVDDDGRPYIMLVNIDLEHSAEYKIRLAVKADLMLVSDITGKEQRGKPSDWIGPGQGYLFRIAPARR